MSQGPDDPRALRAVLFDLDGTLYRLGPVRRAMAWRLLARFVFEPRRARQRIANLRAWRHALEDVRHEERDAIVAHGGVRARQRMLALQKGADARSLDEDVATWMGRAPLRAVRRARRADILDLLAALMSEGLRLGVWSDYAVEAKLDALELRDHFELQLCADDDEISCLKPWPHGFRRAAALWKLPESAIVYVGDRPDVDAVGASAAGMRCIIVGDRARASDGGYESARTIEDLARILVRMCVDQPG